MGGSRRPGRQGGRARDHGRGGPVGPRPGGYSRFRRYTPRDCCHAGHRGVARGPALAGSCRRPAQRREGARPASCGRTRSGAGGGAPRSIPASGRRRRCSTCATLSARRRRQAGAVAPLRRYPEDAAGDSRRLPRRCGTAAPRRRAELTTPAAMGAALSTPAGPFVRVNMVPS